MGIPFISLFTFISAYTDLIKKGKTSWDEAEGFTITHEKIGIIRGIIAIVVYILFLLLLAA